MEAYPWFAERLSLLVSYWLPLLSNTLHTVASFASLVSALCNALQGTWLAIVLSFAYEHALAEMQTLCHSEQKSALAKLDSRPCTPHAGGSKRKGRCAVAPALRFADVPLQLMRAPDRSVDIFRLEVTSWPGRGIGSTELFLYSRSTTARIYHIGSRAVKICPATTSGPDSDLKGSSTFAEWPLMMLGSIGWT